MRLTHITQPTMIEKLINNINYYLDEDNLTAELTMYSYAGDIIIPETVLFNDATYRVTSIGKYAFASCKKLTSITIPDSIKKIELRAFDHCSLTSITIPDSVNTIEAKAFLRCSKLLSITIPASVTSIEKHAFDGCSSLTAIRVATGNTVYDSRENCNAIIETATNTLIHGCQNTIIPDTITSIGSAAFYDCHLLTSITIPDSVEIIGEGAFCGCKSLTSITIPNSVKTIGDGAFSSCSSLTTIALPASITSIPDYAFDDCRSLTTITIPDSVVSIGYRAFYRCLSLTNITIPNSVTSIEPCAFYHCCSLPAITIPDGITSIGEETFAYCKSLTTITIPDSVTSIGEDVFLACQSLEQDPAPKINIHRLTYRLLTHNHLAMVIRFSADSETIDIPSEITHEGVVYHVTSIGDGVFKDCSDLTTITFRGTIAQWNKLIFGEDWACTVPATVVHCTDGDVEI